MPDILPSIACNLDADILSASLPLLQESRVEAIEWSFDTLFQVRQIPDWFSGLLDVFSREKRLIGHGVFFSLFTAKWLPEQTEWLEQLRQTCAGLHFDHITEHFGFMTGQDFHHGAPLNVPYSPSTLAIGQDRLQRIQQTCRCPVGIENLAFSYSPEEVKRHGDFLRQLIGPVNGFIILDLHNFYCQTCNFDIDPQTLLSLYPLDKVREIHISGGSWEDAGIGPARKVRRDTHDDAVPEEVFTLLRNTMATCPNLKFVVLEQLGNGLRTPESKQAFYDDFLKMEKIVQDANRSGAGSALYDFLPVAQSPPGSPVEDHTLYRQQLELSHILETAGSCEEAIHALLHSSLAHTAWEIEKWEPYMIGTAIRIAQKWKKTDR